MTQEPADIARHAAFLEPVPGRNRARVAVEPAASDEWRIDVALRDRPGLLAIVSGVLATYGVDVLDAVVATCMALEAAEQKPAEFEVLGWL